MREKREHMERGEGVQRRITVRKKKREERRMKQKGDSVRARKAFAHRKSGY